MPKMETSSTPFLGTIDVVLTREQAIAIAYGGGTANKSYAKALEEASRAVREAINPRK